MSALIRLSDDIIISHILTRLPVKTLLRFKCVCKSWEYILSNPDPHFITRHIKHTSKHPDYECLIMSMRMDWHHNRAVHILSRSRLSYTRVDNTPSGDLIGSVNGLVCVNYKDLFLLWNPVTGLAKTIVPPQQYFKSRIYGGCLIFGLCWDDVESQYKIVMCYKDTTSLRGFVYASNYDMWNEVLVPDHVFSHVYRERNPGIIVEGCPYWIIVNHEPKTCVTKFETTSNRFKEYSLPFKIDWSRLEKYNLVEVDNRVAVMVYPLYPPTLVEIFLLDEVCGVWSKIYSLNPIIHDFKGMISQCFKYGGEMLFYNGNKLYDPKTNEIKVISDAENIYSSYSYTPSFVGVHGMKPLLTQSHWTPAQRPVFPDAQSHMKLLYIRLERYLSKLFNCFGLA